MSDASVFSPRILLIWVSALAAILGLSLYLFAFGIGAPETRAIGPSAFSRSAIGYAGLAELAHVLAGHGNKAELARMRGNFPAPALAAIDFDVDVWQKARRGAGQLEHFVTRQALAK